MSKPKPDQYDIEALESLLEQRPFSLLDADDKFASSIDAIYEQCKGLPYPEKARIAAALMTMSRVQHEQSMKLRQALARNAELEAMASTDPLTGLRNRRGVNHSLSRDVSEVTRYRDGRFVLFAMIDLDGFKRVNDTLGHDGGDVALVRGAHALQRTFNRRNEVVGRFGGDEMCLVLHFEASDNFNPDAIIEKARRPFASQRLYDEAGRALPLSASVGLACSNEESFAGMGVKELCEAMVKKADERVYLDKWHAGSADALPNGALDPSHPKNRRLAEVEQAMRSEASTAEFNFDENNPA